MIDITKHVGKITHTTRGNRVKDLSVLQHAVRGAMIVGIEEFSEGIWMPSEWDAGGWSGISVLKVPVYESGYTEDFW